MTPPLKIVIEIFDDPPRKWDDGMLTRVALGRLPSGSEVAVIVAAIIPLANPAGVRHVLESYLPLHGLTDVDFHLRSTRGFL